jgi:hypothetical protein
MQAIHGDCRELSSTSPAHKQGNRRNPMQKITPFLWFDRMGKLDIGILKQAYGPP